MSHNRIITITGGTGFVGRQICSLPDLADDTIRVITRDARAASASPLPANVELVEGDVFDTSVQDAALSGSHALVHLVGILNERGHDGSGFDRLHARLPAELAAACLRNGVRRMVNMSALNADAERGTSYYLKSKGRGEDAVHACADSGLDVTSFRPSVIFGAGDSFVNRFAALLKFAPVMPLACPQARFAPVYVGDVAQRFVDAIDDPASFGERIALCGPKDYSLLELVRYIATAAGRSRLIVPLPDVASRMQASVFEYLPGKPFSLDNYRSLQMDSVCTNGNAEATTLESIVPTYIH